MKKGYWVVTYRSISNPEALKAYAPLSLAAMESGGGKPIVRAVATEAHENGIAERTVIVEFPTLQAAIDTFHGPEYAKALAVLGTGSVDRDVRIVEGA